MHKPLLCLNYVQFARASGVRVQQWTPEGVVGLLEEAGATLLSLPGASYPASFRSSWPAFVRGVEEAYGYHDAVLRPPVPSAAAITRMDWVYSLVQLIPTDRHVARRIVLMRSLIHPLSTRLDPHVWSWRRLAKAIGADPRSARGWHEQAIRQIVRRLRAPGLCVASGGKVPGLLPLGALRLQPA